MPSKRNSRISGRRWLSSRPPSTISSTCRSPSWRQRAPSSRASRTSWTPPRSSSNSSRPPMKGGRLSSTRAPGSLIRRAPISPHRARKPTRRSPRLSSSSTTPPLGCRTAAPSSNKVAPTTTAASPNTSRRNRTPMRSWRTPSVASTTPRSRSTIWSAPNGWSWTARRTTVQPASRRTPTAWTASPRCSRSSSSSWRLSWPSLP